MGKQKQCALWAAAMASVLGITRSATATPFTLGDVAVYRVGDGTQTLGNTGNSVFIDEYTPTGTLVQSIAMPTATSGANYGLVASGTATSEGELNRSADGRFLVLTGYSATGATSIVSSTSAANPRVIGLVDAAGGINTTTGLTDYASGNNPRSATSPDGTTIYLTGAAGGIRVTTVGSTTSTQLSTTVTNLRDANIADGNLYVSTSSGSAVRIGQVGTGLPTAAGQTITNLPGIPTSGSPYQFVFADLSADVPGSDTLYVADDTANTITKYSLVGGTYVSNGTITAAAVRGLTGAVAGSAVTLFGATDGSLYSVTDTAGYNAAPSATAVSTFATAGANEAFRGIALAPVAGTSTPEPASLSALAIGAGALLARRRRRAV